MTDTNSNAGNDTETSGEPAQPVSAAPPPLPPLPQGPLQHLFFNDPAAPGLRGLRAGWRFAVFALCLGGVAELLGLLVALLRYSFVVNGGAMSPLPTAFSEGLNFVTVLIASLIMAALERRSFGTYGLPIRSAFGARFWIGTAWGLVSLAALLLAIHFNGDYDFGSLALRGHLLVEFGAEWALAFLIVGLFEEYCFRGYALATLRSGMGFWPSAVLLSLVFGSVHLGNGGEDWVGGVGAALIGLFFCYTVLRTGSLWFAVGFHASWDWGETFLFGVPNSGTTAAGHMLTPPPMPGSKWITGGSVGPEGSVWLFVVIFLVWIVFDRVHRLGPET